MNEQIYFGMESMNTTFQCNTVDITKMMGSVIINDHWKSFEVKEQLSEQ